MSDNASGYTGHVHDTETGITCMQARYHIPEIGRFMSTDSVGYKMLFRFVVMDMEIITRINITDIKGGFAFLAFL